VRAYDVQVSWASFSSASVIRLEKTTQTLILRRSKLGLRGGEYEPCEQERHGNR